MKPKSFAIHTFGCKVNRFDSGYLHEQLSKAGYCHDPSPKAHIHILNTCAVTQTASKEAVKQVRKIKAKNPFCTTILTGCSAQVDTDLFSPLTSIDLIVANSHKPQLSQILQDYFANKIQHKVLKSNIFKENHLQEKGQIPPHETRAFVKIQDGCNSFCTFCIIPFARGKSRSLSIASLVRQVQQLHEKSIKEVVLTGVHIGDYKDFHAFPLSTTPTSSTPSISSISRTSCNSSNASSHTLRTLLRTRPRMLLRTLPCTHHRTRLRALQGKTPIIWFNWFKVS